MYSLFGYMHARLAGVQTRALRGLAAERGQGTVEYVALILLVALIMAGVIAAMKGFKTDQGQALGEAILGKLRDAVDKVQF
jgi:hypothetical protein